MVIKPDSNATMKPKDNVQYWIDCWRSSIHDPDLISDETQADIWNRRSGDFGKDGDEERQKKKTADFLTHLQEGGFSPEGAHVLDIGCGPGSLSIPLAMAGANVTSLDISRGMLHRLRETVDREGLCINTVEASWWTLDIDQLGFRKNFDLVIASKTPSIRDVETFDRMIACSRNYCYYSGFISKHPEKIPGDIYVKILGEVPQTNPFASGFIYPFMYLYTMGVHPIIKFSHRSIKFDERWSEAAEKAIDSLKINRDLSEDMKSGIRDYYKSTSVNGMHNADYEMFSGSMVWSVHP
jgi:SAM-dependent methyltransferase